MNGFQRTQRINTLTRIAEATDSEQHYGMYADGVTAKALEVEGLIEINREIENKGKVAQRITDAGRSELAALLSEDTVDTPAEPDNVTAQPQSKDAQTTHRKEHNMTNFALSNDVAIPARKSSKPSKYPFEAMEINQSFFVPNKTNDEGESVPAISPSTVSGANNRLKAAGRRFIRRDVSEDGVDGVRVWRVAMPEATEAAE